MLRVLIVEDNANVAGVLGQYLQKRGIAVNVAPDGETALRLFSEGSFDLLVVDIRLPSMSGDDVCRKIRATEKGATVPLVLMSGFVREPGEIEQLTRELGAGAFITKPFTSDALYARIASILRLAPPGQAAAATPAAARLPQAITGDLSRTPFEKILLFLYRNRATGLLSVTKEQATRRFTFLGGAPIELEVSSPDDDFGSYLAHKNLAEQAEIEVYRARRRTDATDPRDLFVKMGCLSPERFQDEHKNFLHDLLIGCFAWRSGTVLFEWRSAFTKTAPAQQAFLPALFYRGFREHLAPERLRSFLEEKGSLYPRKSETFYEHQGLLIDELPGPDLLDLIDGLSTCSGIVSAVDDDAAPFILYTFDYLQLLSYSPAPQRVSLSAPFPIRTRAVKQPEEPETVETFEDLGAELSGLADQIGSLVAQKAAEPAAAATESLSSLEQELRARWEEIKNKNYYEIFGMSQNTFSFDKLKAYYFDLTRTYGPEKFFASSGEVMELAEEFLSLVSNAYATLSNVVSKEEYDALLASKAPTAANEKKFYEQVQFQSGKVMLEQGQYESAEKTFTNCLTLNPDKPEYQVYLAVAIYHNPANRTSPAAIKRAKDLVNKSLVWEKTAIAYALKGTMLLDEGLHNLAEAEFNKALRINPKNKTALKKLEEMRQRKDEEAKKGFFQKMFK